MMFGAGARKQQTKAKRKEKGKAVKRSRYLQRHGVRDNSDPDEQISDSCGQLTSEESA